MFGVLKGSWALFLGMFMLMIGNGLQGTLLGLRGEAEGFSTFELSVVMSAYFVGFLFASRMVPEMLRKVGHVRVFAALGSTISAVLIMYPALTEPWAWTIGRVAIGYCFCGVYITAESWLNDASTNETRGKSLSLYMIVQMAGIVLAQYILVLGDIRGFILFIIPSILVSLAFAPILLSVGNAPKFETTKPLSIKRLVTASPLACVGMFALGGVFAAQFGMSAVYGSRAGFSVAQISLMISVTYITALILQYPVGWVSDRMDRRILIIVLAVVGGLGAMLSFVMPQLTDQPATLYIFVLVSAATVGGASNPLYALLIAYANDYLEREDMAAASGGLLFINGLGAIMGPFAIGWAMDGIGVQGFWGVIGVLMLALGAYGGWRMTQRANTTAVGDLVKYAPVGPSASAVMAGAAQDYYLNAGQDPSAPSRDGAGSASQSDDPGRDPAT